MPKRPRWDVLPLLRSSSVQDLGFKALPGKRFARGGGPNFVLSCGAAAVSPPAADVIPVHIGPYCWDQVGIQEMQGDVM